MTTTDPYLFTARNLRVPTADDVPRMASVSVLGFRDSEIFRFTRSLHDTFPDDSVASFAKLYRAQLRDPCTVVIVAEDKPVPDDPGHWASPADIPAMVIVGVASWRLPEAMKSDELVVQDVGMDDATEDRDLSPRRMASYIRAAKQTEQRFLRGKAIFDKLVIHPSYRAHGHAGALVRWGMELCEGVGMAQGVIASHMGQPMYARFGFEVVGEMHVPDDAEAEGFTQSVMVNRCATA